jgi:autotransporter-associated beta strand protein
MLILGASGSLYLNGTNTFSGGVVISNTGIVGYGNNAAFGTGTITIAKAVNITDDNTAVAFTIANPIAHTNVIESFGASTLGTTYSGAWTLPAAGMTTTISLTAGNHTVAGVISGGAVLGIKGGSSIALYATNTYTGGTILESAQIFYFNNSNSFGTGTITLSNVASGGALFAGVPSALTITNPVTLGMSNGITAMNFNFVGTTAGVTYSGPWTMGAATLNFETSGTPGLIDTISGVITGSAGFTVSDMGTLILTGTNLYTGTTTLSATLGTPTLVISGAGDLGDNGSGIGVYGGNIANAGKFTYGSTTTQTLSGIISGAGSLTQTNGTLILSGNNSFTGGTTITAGALDAQSSGSLPGNVTVTGGTLEMDNVSAMTSSATLTLPSSPSGVVNLAYTGTQNISALYFGSVLQAPGTWGAIGSGATHTSAAFSGAGLLNLSYFYWDPNNTGGSGSGGTGSWDSSDTYWFNGSSDVVWVPNYIANFAGTAGTVTLNTSEVANGLAFTTTGYTLSEGSGTPTLTLAGAAPFINVPAAGTAAIGCILTGSAGLAENGAGTLTLSASNVYTGATTIATGSTLTISGAGDLGDNGSGVGTFGNAIANSGTFIYNSMATQTLSGVISGAGALTQNGPGELILTDAANSYTGILSINNGAILDVPTDHPLGGGAGTINFSGGGILENDDATAIGDPYALSYVLAMGTGGGVFFTPPSTAILLCTNLISGTGSLTKTGAGELRLIKAAGNTFMGGLIVSGGILTAGQSTYPITDAIFGAIPASTMANAITIQNGAELRLVDQSLALDAKQGITLGAGGGCIDAISGLTFTIPSVIAGTTTLTIDGSLDGSSDTGVVALTGANSYTGRTTINKGTLTLGSTGSISNSSMITIGAGTTFNVSAYNPYYLSSSTALTSSGTNVSNANITAASGGAVNLGLQPVYLNYTPSYPGYNGTGGSDATNLSLNVLPATGATALTINLSQLEVSNTLGGSGLYGASSAASPGVYNLIQVGDGTTGTINITGPAAPITPGNYPVIVYGAGDGSGAGINPQGANNTGQVAIASVSGSDVILTVTSVPAPANGGFATSIALTPSSSATYGQGSVSATVTPTPTVGGVVQLFYNGAQLGANVPLPASGTVLLPLPVGTYNGTFEAVYSGSADTNYGASSGTAAVSGVTITPESITLTANTVSTPYGTGVPGSTNGASTAFTVTSGALQYGETIGSVNVALALTGTTLIGTPPPAGTTNEWVGTYSATPSAAAGGTFNPANYAITYGAPGTVTITPYGPVTITANSQSQTYGQTTAFGSGSTLFGVSPSPFPNSQTAASLTVTLACSDGTPTTAAGTYSGAITPSAAVAAVGNAGTNFNPGNYSITYANGDMVVNPATATVTANDQSTGYGTVIPSGPGSTLFTGSPLQNGETIGTVTLAVADTATTPVGSYPGAITPSAATGGSGTEANYNFTYVSGTLTVTNNYATFLVTSNYLTNGNLEVCWQSVPGVVYNVLTNTTLVTNATLLTNGWMDALGAANPSSPVTANSTNTCVTISGVSGTNVFVLIKQN